VMVGACGEALMDTGCRDGTLAGVMLGMDVGVMVGARMSTGCRDGALSGALLGLGEGILVGADTGARVGKRVGALMGERVGLGAGGGRGNTTFSPSSGAEQADAPMPTLTTIISGSSLSPSSSLQTSMTNRCPDP
jgi:hypothetical protein